MPPCLLTESRPTGPSPAEPADGRHTAFAEGLRLRPAEQSLSSMCGWRRLWHPSNPSACPSVPAAHAHQPLLRADSRGPSTRAPLWLLRPLTRDSGHQAPFSDRLVLSAPAAGLRARWQASLHGGGAPLAHHGLCLARCTQPPPTELPVVFRGGCASAGASDFCVSALEKRRPFTSSRRSACGRFVKACPGFQRQIGPESRPFLSAEGLPEFGEKQLSYLRSHSL